MDYTPQLQNNSDSGCISSSFESSRFLFESTPKDESERTLPFNNGMRKRKIYYERGTKILNDVTESCTSTPKFSSTFEDESLPCQFENCHIANCRANFYVDTYDSLPNKLFKDSNGKPKIHSAPSTPEKQVKSNDDIPKKPASFIKTLQCSSIQSPLKEARDILYPTLKPIRKPFAQSPKKFKDCIEKSSTPAKKCLFTRPVKELFNNLVNNTIIMNNIFKYLSNGDLYRLCMVSKCLEVAVEANVDACIRLKMYRANHKLNKENYRITPPGSPEKNESLIASEDNKNFSYFYDFTTKLKHNQSLGKCFRCNKAAIIENNVGQCQNNSSCGFIYCLLCSSFAPRPEDFNDKCNNSKLILGSKCRNRLVDLSNSDFSESLEETSFFTSTFNNSIKYESSGFYSECESSPSVKRNLSLSFMSPVEKPKVLSINNRSFKSHQKLDRRCSLVPVVQAQNVKEAVENIEPSSPPKVKSYAACSKQSKRNLKRLTR